MRPALLRKRCFVQMIGYEPVSVAHQHRRFIREMARFQKTWNVQSKVSPASLSADGAVANWTVDTWGPNWSVATDYYYFRWDDFVSADMRESDWWRFPLGIAALVEFILTGTVLRYFVTAWRYGCFFVLPLFYILGMLWLSIAVARNVVHHSNLAYSSFWAPPLAFAVFVVLRLTFGRLLFIRFALDDWYFARDFIHRVRPGIGDRLDRFARELVRLARETDADEIIIYGHSLGAPLSLVVVDRALELDPRLGRRGRPVHVVSSGSSLRPIIKERVDIRKYLVDKELGSRLTYLETLQQLTENQKDLVVQKSRLQETDAALAGIISTRQQTEAEFRRTLFSELNEAERKAGGLADDLSKAERRTKLQLLTAPVDGVVQQLAVHTVGGVVTPELRSARAIEPPRRSAPLRD